MYVCPLANLKNSHVQALWNFLCVLSVVVAQSSSDDNVILVLWIMPCFHEMGHTQTSSHNGNGVWLWMRTTCIDIIIYATLPGDSYFSAVLFYTLFSRLVFPHLWIFEMRTGGGKVCYRRLSYCYTEIDRATIVLFVTCSLHKYNETNSQSENLIIHRQLITFSQILTLYVRSAERSLQQTLIPVVDTKHFNWANATTKISSQQDEYKAHSTKPTRRTLSSDQRHWNGPRRTTPAWL